MRLSLYEEVEWLFPFQGMAIGDSFFIPTLKTAQMIYAAESGAKRAGIRVKTFVTTKEDYLGVRVWRIA